MKTLLFALALLAGCASFAAPAGQTNISSAGVPSHAAPTPSFAQVVTQYFSQWDTNGDGTLSTNEINAAVANPAFHDEAAAALAAIKLVVRGGKYNLPPLTQAYLVASPLREPTATGTQTNLSGLPYPAKKIDHPPAFQPRYRSSLARLRRTAHDLFPQTLPSLDACHQGPLGDCYFISVVGAMVYRDPSAVKAMFTENHDGSTTVAFGNGRSVTVPPLTDAETALSSSAFTNGLWLTVLENAFGKTRVEDGPDDQKDEPGTDAIAHGGKPGKSINILDGYQARTAGLVLKNGQHRGPEFADSLQKDIDAALHAHRLAEATTPTIAKLPPGINAKHAYAILDYHSETGLVRVWNPHGNNFHPKGPDGLQYGYTTKAGQFDIPLKDLIQIYQRVIFETPTPVQPALD